MAKKTLADGTIVDTDLQTVTINSGPTFSIAALRSRIGKLARPNLFTAKIYGSIPLIALGVDVTSDVPNFAFRCEKAELPGRTLATIDDSGAGPTLKLPYDITYNDMTISVICSQDMKEREFFETWMDAIVHPGSDSLIGGKLPGLISYHSDYARGVKMEIAQLDDDAKSLYTYVLQDVFPIALTSMNATWEETNTYQRFGVTLSYRYHTRRKGS
jgi:hypothetical protein